MITCPYCKKESNDIEFCDNCGKILYDVSEEKSENKKVHNDIYRYNRDNLECISFLSNLKRDEISDFDSDLIQKPIYIKNNKLYFIDNDEVSLEEYLEENELNFEEIVNVFTSIAHIFKTIEDNGYILGSISLSDFWIEDKDISRVIYRQTRRLLKEKEEFKDYNKGDICSPEVLNEDIEFINKSTDVYLLGRLFINLAINKSIDIEDYQNERYIAYNMSLFNNNIPKFLHNWIGKSTNIFSEKRYNSIEECLDEFLYLLEVSNKRSMLNCENLNINYSSITDVGKSKSDTNKDTELSKLNEDTFLVLESNDKLFAMVSDGVSNCSYGSGYDAANIIKDVSYKLWKERSEDINDLSSVEKFISDIVDESNKNIFNSVKEDIEGIKNLSKGIMAATFSAVVIIKNKMYYTSLGDSPIYLLNKDVITRLNSDDNLGNQSLIKKVSWSDYKHLDSKSALTRFIGGNYSLEQSDKININIEFLNLLDNDLVMICSDGVTDYINPIYDKGDIWNKDETLKYILKKHSSEFENINNKLVELANENGGGDNITSVLLKATINN